MRSDSSPVLAVDAGQSSTRVRCEPGPWGPGWIVTSSGVRTALPLAQQFATIMHDVATAHPEITQSECTVAIGSSGARDDEDPIPVLHALKPFGVSRVLLAHDSITSYLGALGDQLGVVTASGTGVITLAVGRHNVARVDGWGYIIGDAGSAFWLGRHGWMLSCAPTMVAASRQSLATPSATTLTTSRLPTWNSMPTRSWSHGSRPTQPQSPPQPKKGTTSPVISACAQPMS
ncbi:hypothetical protein JCM18916_3615 [Cutibacterium acnes JCM 18916]|nr:hypothetical protein JCM18916_3615 [Cutibacterium acnes JCM 18916]